MRNTLPIAVILLGIVAAAAMVWLLMSGHPEAGEGPIFGTETGEKEKDPLVISDLRDPSKKTDEALSSTLPDEVLDSMREKLLPVQDTDPLLSSMRIHVTYLGSNQPVPHDELSLTVDFNGLPFGRSPEPQGEPGQFLLDRILPGLYTLSGHTTAWEKGKATCTVVPGSDPTTHLQVAAPTHLMLQVIDSQSSKPVHNARIESKGFIENGLTDEEGLFESARKFIPDTEQVLRISHAEYFSSLFEPNAPAKAGARKTGKGNAFTIPLRPLAGNLTLAGVLVDEDQNPLPGWAIILTPASSEKAPYSYWTKYTDRSGAFRFDRLKPGNYLLSGTLRLLVSYYLKKPPTIFEHAVTLAPGQSRMKEVLVCSRARQPFVGRLILAETNEALPGAQMRFLTHPGPVSSQTVNPLFFSPMTTNDEGAFETRETFLPEEIFRLLIYGNIQITTPKGIEVSYRVKQSADGLRRLQSDIVLGKPITLWITEQQGQSTLYGRVVDAKGLPLAQVKVYAESNVEIYHGHHRGFTDKDGYFEIPNLYPGRWVLKTYLPRGPQLSHAVSVPEKGKPPECILRVLHNCQVTGKIVTDAPPSRMRIRINGLHYETDPLTIGSNLSYGFQYLPPGKALITLESYEGRRYQENALTVHEEWVYLKANEVAVKDFRF